MIKFKSTDSILIIQLACQVVIWIISSVILCRRSVEADALHELSLCAEISTDSPGVIQYTQRSKIMADANPVRGSNRPRLFQVLNGNGVYFLLRFQIGFGKLVS